MQIELFEVLKKINRLESSIDKSLLVNTTPAFPSRLEPTPQHDEPAPPHKYGAHPATRGTRATTDRAFFRNMRNPLHR